MNRDTLFPSESIACMWLWAYIEHSRDHSLANPPSGGEGEEGTKQPRHPEAAFGMSSRAASFALGGLRKDSVKEQSGFGDQYL